MRLDGSKGPLGMNVSRAVVGPDGGYLLVTNVSAFRINFHTQLFSYQFLK